MKTKFTKVYKGPFTKEEAERFKDYFIEVSKKPFLELEYSDGNYKDGYHYVKIPNDFKGSFIRRRPHSDLYDVFVKIREE